MKFVYKLMLFFISFHVIAQKDTSKPNLIISGYLEVYYSYDFSKPSDHNRPFFIYSYNRSNEVNLNIGYIKASYENAYSRANFAIMTGTYANANLASEPGLLKMIYEANAGIKIHKRKSIWIDAGVFNSHLGAESAVGKDCWNLTRSLYAENSPYYETGAKISYNSDNAKWFLSALFLNGWQHIQRPSGNNSIALGHQITFTPTKNILLNSSSFIGNDKPDSVKQMRYFHDLYGKFHLYKNIDLLTGFDIGAEQKKKGSNTYNIWYTPYIIVRYKLSSQLYIGLRGEYYHDKNGVIIPTGTSNGFQTVGYSINADYHINSYVLWRVEARSFDSKDMIFTLNNKSSKQNYCITTSIAISF